LYLKSASRVEDFDDSAAQEGSVSRTKRFKSRAVREWSGSKIEQKCGSVYVVTWVYNMIPDQWRNDARVRGSDTDRGIPENTTRESLST